MALPSYARLCHAICYTWGSQIGGKVEQRETGGGRKTRKKTGERERIRECVRESKRERTFVMPVSDWPCGFLLTPLSRVTPREGANWLLLAVSLAALEACRGLSPPSPAAVGPLSRGVYSASARR